MIVAGDPTRFAIECQPCASSGTWIHGQFRFWLGSRSVGNWADLVDLRGCVNWLRDFTDNPRDRYERELVGAAPHRVFELVYEPMMTPSRRDSQVADPFGRFHIAHLGMSSFDRFDVLLLHDHEGRQRCLWREGDSVEISEQYLPPHEMETIAREFCDRFESAMPKLLCRLPPLEWTTAPDSDSTHHDFPDNVLPYASELSAFFGAPTIEATGMRWGMGDIDGTKLTLMATYDRTVLTAVTLQGVEAATVTHSNCTDIAVTRQGRAHYLIVSFVSPGGRTRLVVTTGTRLQCHWSTLWRAAGQSGE